jgi:dihydroorotate dehydrogenase
VLYRLVRSFLFRIDPERAHALSITALRLAGGLPPLCALLRWASDPERRRPVKAFGLTFENCLGLAAGYDKDGLAWRGLAALGFGHVEIGTVTPRPQPGNPRPRVFRLREDRSLINRLGFPSRGADSVVKRLQHPRPHGLVLGVNLGKQADTPLDRAVEDYVRLMDRLAPYAD